MKRQHSFKQPKKEKKGDVNGLFRLFKGERSKQNGATVSQEPNNMPFETHPTKSNSSLSAADEKQRKAGFRQSMAKMLSPTGKNKKPKRSAAENFQKYKVPEEDSSVIHAISEIEESSHYQVDPDDYAVVSPVHSRKYIVKPLVMPPKVREDEVEEHPRLSPRTEKEEVVTTADSEDEMFVDKPDDIAKEVVDPYLDDNDGKKETCSCEGCIIL